MPTLTPAEVRPLFPATGKVSYLNAAAASPIALPVEQAITGHYREALENGDTGFEAWLARRDRIREGFARFIGAEENEVAFVGSTSIGFHFVARFLIERGVHEVLTLEGEFPSTTLPLLNQGLRLRVVRARPDGTYALEDIEAAISRRTGAIAASAVQYSSGYRLDLSAVGKLCRANDLLFAVNGAQALGQIPLDVGELGIDFLCGTSHKWMMGGYGVGLFFARSRVMSGSTLPAAGWLSVDNPMGMNNVFGAEITDKPNKPYFEAEGAKFRQDVSALEVGNSAFGLVFGFGAALELHEQLGIENTERHIASLQAILRKGLRSRGFVPNLPDDPAIGSGICVFPVQGDVHDACRQLSHQGVIVTPRGGGLRASTHVFNNEEDVERFFFVVDKLGLKPAERA